MKSNVSRIAKAADIKNLMLNHFVPANDKSLAAKTWKDVASTFFLET